MGLFVRGHTNAEGVEDLSGCDDPVSSRPSGLETLGKRHSVFTSHVEELFAVEIRPVEVFSVRNSRSPSSESGEIGNSRSCLKNSPHG